MSLRRVAVAAALALLAMLPGAAAAQTQQFKYTLSSGPFTVPDGASSIDWVVTNDSSKALDVRVTVYEYQIGTPRTVTAPGPLTFKVDPFSAVHNANTVGIVFQTGAIYEVQVETDSLLVLPMVNAWPGSAPPSIAGTLIPSGAWVRLR